MNPKFSIKFALRGALFGLFTVLVYFGPITLVSYLIPNFWPDIMSDPLVRSSYERNHVTWHKFFEFSLFFMIVGLMCGLSFKPPFIICRWWR